MEVNFGVGVGNKGSFFTWLSGVILALILLAACQPQSSPPAFAVPAEADVVVLEQEDPQQLEITPYPTRPPYSPGELVDYMVQTGDTLPALARHFNTSVEEIREANPIIPGDVTTLPPGMPMKIPIYFEPLWGTPFQIIPDSQYVNGPLQVGFNSTLYLVDKPGWLSSYREYASGANRTGGEIVDLVARNFSLNPRMLLAILEYQTGALTQADAAGDFGDYFLGNVDRKHRGLYLQLVWAANTLNNAYYAWRKGDLDSITRLDGTLERPDPWQNAASVALQYYYSRLLLLDEYQQAIGPDGLYSVYEGLFGNPWLDDQAHIPGSLTQPEMLLPFQSGETWALTGGPHTGWGQGEPFAALDFAPPSVVGGCVPSNEWGTAVAAGVVVRSEPGVVVLDLDGDGEERTGWTIFYLHIGNEGRIPLGARLSAGDPVGHPSCEGGTSTGTHIHIARKYNGEWILAEGPLAFNLDGWVAQNGENPYQGTLTRFSQIVTACECSDSTSFITAEEH